MSRNQDFSRATRRTVIRTAAWAAPAVSLAAAAPAFAVSGTPTLTFTQPAYAGTACDSITGVQVQATTNGTATVAGTSVEVTLQDGYTFPNGSSTYTGVTNAAGVVALPAVSVPAWGGGSVFSATTGALSTTAAVSAPAGPGTAYYRNQFGTVAAYQQVPKGATAVGHAAFLTAAGELYVGNTLVASGVSSAVGDVADNGNDTVVGFVEGGVAKFYHAGNGATSTFSIPANSTPVGRNIFLAPNGNLFMGNTLIGSGVTSASARINDAGRAVVGYVNATGGHLWTQTGVGVGTITNYGSVPASATAVGGSAFRGSGDAAGLWVSGNLVATGVSAAYGDLNINDDTVVAYMRNGVATRYSPAQTVDYTSVPATATPVGSGSFLQPNGILRQGNAIIATHVTSATGRSNFNNSVVYGYVAADACY